MEFTYGTGDEVYFHRQFYHNMCIDNDILLLPDKLAMVCYYYRSYDNIPFPHAVVNRTSV